VNPPKIVKISAQLSKAGYEGLGHHWPPIYGSRSQTLFGGWLPKYSTFLNSSGIELLVFFKSVAK
jgi:hypothetical protein